MNKNSKIKFLSLLSLFMFVAATFMITESIKVNAAAYDSASTYYIEVDVDDPMTIEEIMEEIELGASLGTTDLSDYIVSVNGFEYINFVLLMPQAFMRALNEYELQFEVASPYGVTSHFKVIAVVKDMSGPELITEYSKMSYTFLRSDVESGKAYSVIENSVVAVDNVDLFDVKKTVQEIEYNEEVSDYITKLSLTDKLNNETLVDVEVKIINDMRIRIVMDSAYSLIETEKEFETSEILESAGIKAYDTDGTEVPVQIQGEYPQYLTEPGIYVIDLKAETEDGDFTMAQHIIFVPNLNKPIFFLDENKVIVNPSKLYTKKDFENIIRMKVGNRAFTYEVVEDNYTENYTEVGEYDYEIEVTFCDEEGKPTLEKTKLNFVMKVIENEEKLQVENNELNFFERIIEIIKKIGQKIFGVIKWPIQYLGKFF